MRRLVVLAVLLAACTSTAGEATTATSTVVTTAASTGSSATTTGQAVAGETVPATSGATVPAGGTACWAAPATGSGGSITLEDATEAFGLVEPLTGIMGHAGAWGDVNGDLAPDLFVGTFANRPLDVYQVRGADGPRPDRVFLAEDGGFADIGMEAALGRTSGAAFADLDLDGDPDLVLSRNPQPGRERGDAPSTIYRNDGGTMVEVADAGLDPVMGARSIGVLHIDGDGLLDLVVLEDRWTGASSKVYRNLGDLRFEDSGSAWGFPADVHGLGVATGDLDGDGLTDVVVGGSNRVFRGTGDGLEEVPGAIPEWEVFGDEDDVAGVSITDVNRDGRLDVVVGHHYNSTLSRGTLVPVRLYLNRTDSGRLALEDVTDRAGLVGLPTKAPHVEFVDLDNDGLVDILTSASAADGTIPAVFRNTGIGDDGVPSFEPPAGLGAAQYWVAMPTADVDRDGRVDMLGVEWEASLPSPFFHNTSAAGHWLEVSVDASLGGGPGTKVAVYEAGGAGDPGRLLGLREITVTQGYSAGNQPIAHFGLGDVDSVDVVVTPSLGGEVITLEGLAADQHLRLPAGC